MPQAISSGSGQGVRYHNRKAQALRLVRCGDGTLCRAVNGLTGLATTLLDVLDALDEVKVCVAYEYRGERLEHFPADLEVLEECRPIYETLSGWKEEISAVRSFEELPEQAQAYLQFIAEQVGCPVQMVSVGPRRIKPFFCSR